MSTEPSIIKTRSKSQSHSRSRSPDRTDHALIQEVIKDLLQSQNFLSLVEESINKRVRDMEETIEKQDGLIMELQHSNNEKEKDIANLKKQIISQHNSIQAIDTNLNTQEQYSRRNCVRLFGCKERPGENTDLIAMKVASDHLKVDLKLEDIERSHRVGQRKENRDGGGEPIPRAIIIKFKSYRKRQEYITNRRKLKGLRMSIAEDLTIRNQKLLTETGKHEKVEAAWSRDGRIFALVKHTDGSKKKRLIHNSDELAKL